MNTTRPPDPDADADGDAAERNRRKLLEEYGSVLDESLIILIVNERDVVKDYADISEVLDELAGPARAEAATGFDPSGLGSVAEVEGLRLDETTTSGNGLDSFADYSTSISEYSDQSENRRLTEETNLSDEQKIQELGLVFQGRFRDHTLAYILKQTGGDLERAFDELLNRQHLEDSSVLPKGIDGFFNLDEDLPAKGKTSRARKGNGKTKKQVLAIKYKAVSSTVDEGELEGAKDFAQSADSRGAGLTRRVLPSAPTVLPAISTPRLAQTPSDSSPVTSDFGAVSMRAAASLRRMGPLGRQGAVVYTERAREERGTLTVRASQAAEAHVARQSTATLVDLHGVFVMDGVRIAKQRVWAWWNGLGENRKALARQNGFTIVTGVGKHSAGGVSRLRQAVGAFLKNDGWKVETLTGKFYVTGRV
ncbi:hypothetical protein N657DRAFT_584740 [Parathielavia appendiculata]|uniref:Smr domain-containing protein n=1 Tax=Parathielavia appendiculata TaxID=2587402 RepID=A0AAN6Z7Q8_9PEZI|nr:hypothetical protein N657DRAFT_584740 [Parathielavia appendiculata]